MRSQKSGNLRLLIESLRILILFLSHFAVPVKQGKKLSNAGRRAEIRESSRLPFDMYYSYQVIESKARHILPKKPSIRCFSYGLH